MRLSDLQQLKVSGVLRHTLAGITKLPGRKVKGVSLAVDMESWGHAERGNYRTCLAGYTMLSMLDLEQVKSGVRTDTWHKRELQNKGIPWRFIQHLEFAMDAFRMGHFSMFLEELKKASIIDTIQEDRAYDVLYKLSPRMEWSTKDKRLDSVEVLKETIKALESEGL